MANPSLQIGNSNWAIKEDNLLGYSTAGTKFLPQPITMTRASAGTRVNSSGLVETVELLGSELITDGNFALTGTQAESTTGTYWSTGASWTIANNIATYGGLGEPYLNNLNAVNIQVGQTFIFTFTLNSDAKLRFVNEAGARFQGTWVVYAQGTHTVYITSGISATLIGIQADTNNGSFGVSNISVKESTKNNLARVDYDGTASSLLVEPQRTNLITYSEDFSQSSWIKVGSSIISNSINSPTGNLTASTLKEDTSNGLHQIYNTNFLTTVIGNYYTFSFYAKANTRTKVNAFLQIPTENNVEFDLSNGTATIITGSPVFSITNVGNNWYRCVMTALSNSAGSAYVNLIFNNGTSYIYQGDGISSIYIWGAQVEEGAYPTSYIPTSGSTVTRVQDQYSKTGISNLINSEEGVLFAEIAAFEGANTDRQISISDGSTSNRVVMALLSNGTQIQFVVSSGGSITVNTTQTIPTIISGTKIAFAYKVNNFKIYANGILIANDTNGTVPTGLSVLAFNRGDGNDIFFGKVKQLQVFKTALTDTELATLTTI